MWTQLILDLQAGETVKFRPRGYSMAPRIKSGQLVTVRPITKDDLLEKDMVVLCKVHNKPYLHLIKAIRRNNQVQIGNNKGGINGWTSVKNVFGIMEEEK